MRIDRVTLRIVRLPLRAPFETSFGACHAKTCILVSLDGEGVTGWGECVADVEPYFGEETLASAWYAMRDFLVPALLRAAVAAADETHRVFARVRGNRMAKAALEMAAWDWFARAAGVPLYRYLGGTRDRVPCGVSIGIQPTVADLLREVEGYLAAGYRRIKIKIKPGWDLEPLRAVRRAFGAIPLMADANSAYTGDDVRALRALDGLGLTMLEQPLAWDDLEEHRALQEVLATPLCLDESIRHAADARHALDSGAARVVNLKPGRVGGHAESLRIDVVCRARGAGLWCGGMLETGIGRGHNLALASLDGFTHPGDTSDSRRYFDEDITEPRAQMGADGTIPSREAPGIGYEPRAARIEALSLQTQVMRRC